MSERYNDKTKRLKPQDTRLEILKILCILAEIQQRALGPEEGAAGVTYLSMKIHPKCIFPLKFAATLLSGSREGAVRT